MHCSQKDTCLNYGKQCYKCGAMSDVFNHYPCYTNKIDQMDKLMKLLNEFPEILYRVELTEYLINNGVRVEVTE